MIWILLFLVGILLSAFFSGSETGFYRATRVRLVLDGMSGDPISRLLLWMTNHPALFVATTLVGNNLANYLVSMAIVYAQHAWWGRPHWSELITPIVLSPIIFIYGELLPKHLFLQAPNAMLRRTGPVFAGFALLFLPVSAILWALSYLLGRLVGESAQKSQLLLARRELARVFDEGHLAGVLRPAQRRLAIGLIENAQDPVVTFVTPIQRLFRVMRGSRISEALRAVRKYQESDVLVVDDARGEEMLGYVKISDLLLENSETIENVRPFMRVLDAEAQVSVLMRMYEEGEDQALVTNQAGNVIGLVTSAQLSQSVLG